MAWQVSIHLHRSFIPDSNTRTEPGQNFDPSCLGPKKNIFHPLFPASCPYITSVGATGLLIGSTVFEPESALYIDYGNGTLATSGGGFSNIFPRPDYQAVAVAAFFDNHNPPHPSYSKLAADAPNPARVDVAGLAAGTDGLYNRIGRGYPDVSANGAYVETVVKGVAGFVPGSSASAPIFASIINRLVEERLARGKGPLGFLNPSLYAYPWVFNDIVNGSNAGCITDGFAAVPGWDPVTGLGTPNYLKMRDVFVNQLP